MTLVIAEVGVNHNGSEELAIELVKAAKDAGADVVKFQTFNADKLATEQAKQAEYQKKNIGYEESQSDMLKRLELSEESYARLSKFCDELGVEFLSTAFDAESLTFLVEEIGIKRLKIPSGEITNAPFLLEHAQYGLPIIVSTGMASLADIERALGVIAFGYLGCKEKPSEAEFSRAYLSDEGQALLREKVSVLHCTTEYPAPMADINLNAMDTMARAFSLPVGYSDHSEGTTVPIAAVAKGAKIIEKHITLDRSAEGPDHLASMEPEEFAVMVQSIRDVSLALGNGVKGPRPSELKNKAVARRSIVAAKAIKAGQIFDESMIDVKRPGDGLSPFCYWEMLGRKASRDYIQGELIVD